MFSGIAAATGHSQVLTFIILSHQNQTMSQTMRRFEPSTYSFI